jgi:outer membrane protein OmpA-like peptidoglycan-associated protein
MFMKYLSILLLTFLTFESLNAQERLSGNYKKDFDKAAYLWNSKGDFSEALVIFKNLLEQDPTNSFLKFAIGDCYLNSMNEKYKALTYLKQAVDSVVPSMNGFIYQNYKNRLAPFDVYNLLGIAYRINYEFDKGLAAFEKYENLMGLYMNEQERKDLKREIAYCKTGKNLVKYPVEIEVTSLGKVVNGKFPDYAPVLSADEKTLIFTSRRGNDWDKKDPNDFKFYEQVYISEKNAKGEWSVPVPISQRINRLGIHQATVGLSVDGQQLLLYSCFEEPNGNIYYSKLEGGEWMEPVPFDAINSKASEVDACFNSDGSVIYFSSDRKGGYGGFDIYKITKLANGKWSIPQNLGPEINTDRDERSPFIHPDGVTMFFASDGHESMGGFDILQSTQDERKNWLKPENIGYPINTTDDDLFYVTSVDGKRAYYASAKLDGEGDKDLYMLEIKKVVEEKPLTVMSGTFSIGDANNTVPPDAQIIVTDNETGDLVAVFRPNQKTGKYLFILPPGKNYNVSYEASGYLFNSENLIVPKNSAYNAIQREIKLAPIRANESIVLNNVFFDFNSDNLTPDSKIELEKLKKLLLKNPSIRVEISGHTDSKGNAKLNKDLSSRRANSVKKLLVENGIDSKRIETVGFGSDRPIAKNTNDDGSDNPEGRQLNRRIELKVLSEDGSMDNVVNKINVPKKLKKK